MKIVQVTPAFLPHLGGVETHVAEISKEFLAAGHQVVIFSVESNSENNVTKSFPWELVCIPSGMANSKWRVWSWIWNHRIDFFSADVIHVHDVGWWLIPLLLFISNKLFITFHGWEGVYPVPWKNKLQRWLLAKMARATVHVGAWIQEFYWDKPSLVMYGGVPPTLTKKKESKTSSDIVFIGRLEASNDIEKYLQLVASLKKSQPDLSCLWVGDGSYRDQCEKWGKVTGMVADPNAYVAQARLVLASSYLSILSAQAVGKVVVGLYSQPLKKRYLETYPGIASMIFGDDVDLVAQKMLDLDNNHNKKQQLEFEAAAFAANQTWDKIAKQYIELWKYFHD